MTSTDPVSRSCPIAAPVLYRLTLGTGVMDVTLPHALDVEDIDDIEAFFLLIVRQFRRRLKPLESSP